MDMPVNGSVETGKYCGSNSLGASEWKDDDYL